MRFIPIKYKRSWLTPCKFYRAKRLVIAHRAVFFQDKILGLCIRIKGEISEYDETKDNAKYTIGIDKGSQFTGITLMSNKDIVNLELYDHKPKFKLDELRSNRRNRRSRLRHRKCKFDSDKGKSKISKTSNYYFQLIKSIVDYLYTRYNFTNIVIEDVKFNHYISDKGRSFSNIEIGKNRLYSYLRSLANLTLIEGKETSKFRKEIFINDPKNKDKSIKNFYSHCIDSFILANMILNKYNSSNIKNINTKVIFLTHIDYIRRKLYTFKNKVGNSKSYFRYKKYGIKVPFDHYSKLKKIRIKEKDNCKSNHGPWLYQYLDPVITFKKFKSKYGGTKVEGRSRLSLPRGFSKYWDTENKWYKYYEVEE